MLLLIANLGWTTLCLGGYMAKTMVVTSALTAALVVVHALAWVWPRRSASGDLATEPAGEGGRPLHAAGLWFVPFVIYAAVNVRWITPARWLGWVDWFGWAQMLVVFWVMLNGVKSRLAQRAVFGALLVIGVVAVWLACYQRFVDPNWLMLHRVQADQYLGRSSGPFGIPNSLAALLLLLLPATGALAFRRQATLLGRILFGWLTVVFLLGLGLTVSRGAWLGLAIALTVWPLVGLRLSWWRRGAIAVGVAASLALVGGAVYVGSPLVRERFSQLARDRGERSRPILWRAAWRMLEEHPVAGAGAGSFNVRFEKYRPEGFLLQPGWAHNDYLNTLSDYGAIGFALFFGAAIAVGAATRRAARRSASDRTVRSAPTAIRRDWLDDPRVRQGLGIGLLGFSLQLFVDFHFKIPALAMAFACVAALLLARVWPQETSPGDARVRWLTSIAALGLAGAVGFGIAPLYRGEALRFQAREAMDRMAKGAPDDMMVRNRMIEVRQELDRAVAIAPSNGQAWADRAYATAQWFRLEPSASTSLGKEAEADADRAIDLSPIVAEFWVRRGVALDIQGRWSEAGPVFAQAIVLSPNAVLPSYHYAYHMSLRPTGLDMAEAAVEFCLRLDPTNPEALRLRQRLASGR